MRSASRFWMTCGISTAIAVLLLVSGGRHAPLPRLGCDTLPSVVSGALSAAPAFAAPLRQTSGKQRQRWASATPHAAHGMAASLGPRIHHPPVALVVTPSRMARVPHARHLRGMLPLSQAPPRSAVFIL